MLDRLREERRWSRPSPAPRSRRVGFVGPLGSGGGPVGQWNQTFLERLAQHDDLDVRMFSERTAGLEAPYDDVVYSLADDDHHTATLAALRRRKDGIVVAHDAYLSDLYVQAARTGDLPGGLEGRRHAPPTAMPSFPEWAGATGSIPPKPGGSEFCWPAT